MLFLVTGALGLPLLYKSPAFSKNAKILLTVAVLLYTILIVILFVVAMVWMWRLVQQLSSNIQ